MDFRDRVYLDPDSLFVVVDSLTGDIVYRTTYRHRNRARRWAERKDLQYGAARYYCKRIALREVL